MLVIFRLNLGYFIKFFWKSWYRSMTNGHLTIVIVLVIRFKIRCTKVLSCLVTVLSWYNDKAWFTVGPLVLCWTNPQWILDHILWPNCSPLDPASGSKHENQMDHQFLVILGVDIFIFNITEIGAQNCGPILTLTWFLCLRNFSTEF